MENKRWHETMLALGRYRNNVAACYIPSCRNNASRAFRGHESGRVNFYCNECADDILSIFPLLFEEVVHRGA